MNAMLKSLAVLIVGVCGIGSWAEPDLYAQSAPWARAYGTEDIDQALALELTQDGGFIVAGSTGVDTGGDTFYADMEIMKITATGSVVWHKTYGGNTDDSAQDIQQTSDGGFVVLGGIGSSDTGPYDYWVLKLNSSGGISWQKSFGGSTSDDHPNSYPAPLQIVATLTT